MAKPKVKRVKVSGRSGMLDEKDKLATASLILGFLSIFGIILTIIGALLGIAGIMAAMASRRRKKFFLPYSKWGLGLSIAGLVGSVGFFLFILFTQTLPSL